MRYNRTEHYFNACTEYRASLRGIWADFYKKMQHLERYKGSAGYEKEKANAEKTRDEAIMSLQTEYRDRFGSILKGMRESATTRSMIPPTQEELSLLTALKMRDKISRDELEQAGRTLKESPVCLSVLQEIAQNLSEKTGSHEYYGLRFETESTSGILGCIDSLAESAKRICSLKKCDSRADMVAHSNIHSPEWESRAMYAFRVDKDVTSTRDAMEYFGGVQNLESFEAAVNE